MPQHASNGGCVETAERKHRRFAHFTEQRAAQVNRRFAPAQFRQSPSARIRRRDERAGYPKCASDPPGLRKRLDDPALETRHAANGPIGSVLSGLRRDLIVRVAFDPEKAQDGRERRQPNRALAQTGRAEPVLVELDPVRQHVLDGLVHAGNKHPPDSRFAHRKQPGGFAPPDPPTPSLAGAPNAPRRSGGALAFARALGIAELRPAGPPYRRPASAEGYGEGAPERLRRVGGRSRGPQTPRAAPAGALAFARVLGFGGLRPAGLPIPIPSAQKTRGGQPQLRTASAGRF